MNPPYVLKTDKGKYIFINGQSTFMKVWDINMAALFDSENDAKRNLKIARDMFYDDITIKSFSEEKATV